MATARQVKHDYVYNTIKQLLVYIYDPKDGLPIEQITKRVWPDWRGFDGPKFRHEAKYIERIISEMRENAKAGYYADVNEARENAQGNPNIEAYLVPPPDYMPFALAQQEHFWCYFNCVKKPFVGNVEKILRMKAEGLIRTADFLDEAFKP